MKLMKTDTREKKALRQAFLRFLPIPLVLILISSVIISYQDLVNHKKEILYRQQDQSIAAMIDYRNEISHLTSIVRTIESDYLTLAARGASNSDYEALFMENMLSYPFIDKLRILDINGMEILCLKQGDDSPYVVAAEDLQDKSMRHFYQEARVLGRHQFLFSGLDLNTDEGIIDIDPTTGLAKPTLRITSPVAIDERRFGYLVVNFLMREYLDNLRTSLNEKGCYILLLDENGYIYNDADDANNFGFCYDETSERYSRTIYLFFPDIDLTAESGFFVQNDKICSYISYTNIYDRSKDYFLSEAAAQKFILLIYYDNQSSYAHDLTFSFFYHLITSWRTQLLVWSGIVILYTILLRLIFLYDRVRFTNLFIDNRYPKTLLRQALNRHQFINYYQPIINIQDGSVLGFEALSRWNYNGQLLPPSMFIDEMLHYQLGQKLDENVFRIVREDIQQIKRHLSLDDAFISINCCQQTFNSLIQLPPGTTIQLTEEEKKYIVLELVENIIFNQSTQERIQEMYKHNILFAIDDFGTGYSNVAFIRRFENLKVKIDRTFVPVDTNDHKERVIIEAFVKMFVDQGLKLIVEGVETLEQIQYLRKLGIFGVQGFYFSRPMSIDKLIEFIDRKDYLKKL
jgi:EAL domain-containing protein (putative c-di-GMP-specific phosphodiesterase class I)